MKRESTYKLGRILTSVFVAGGFSFAIIENQLIVGLAFLAVGIVSLQVLRTRYKSVVLSDERTKRIGEKAAQSTFILFIVGNSGIIYSQLVLSSAGIKIPELQALSEPLSYMIMAFMLVYGVFSLYYSRKL